MSKQISSAVLRNREPILDILSKYFIDHKRLLEVGSGAGEHATYFCEHFPKLQWVTSDVRENERAIVAHLRSAKMKNVHGPEILKVGVDDLPKGVFDYVFSANTLHIMSWKEDKALFKLLGKRLREGALVIFYGPFNYAGEYTSYSNEAFDKWLKDRNEKSGIRNFEDVVSCMTKGGFKLLQDHEMPSNNRTLVFERLPYIKK
ncbi:hypothetical protein A9Q84_00680 [Halobacteriovorax marinus]|uniref:Methylase n=1 Tax=Halobacteriovorax marinus TaxID=97084 RepID=A0A1Y5FBS9_9BACT|nr:hypothetical protein A9Q84_00680 [Halobacteriovorax marinus]